MKTENLNVFSGENALWNYLNPRNHIPTPLVELPRTLNPLTDKGVRIFAKQMQLTPLLNVKSISAFSMMEAADSNGELLNADSFIESSSMNMALCLSILGKNRGVLKGVAVIDDNTNETLKKTLRLYGLSLKECPYVADPTNDTQPSRVQLAKQFAKDLNAFHCGQYSNPANPRGHEQITGPQIWEQTQGKLSVFSSTLGTCGTLVGSMQYIRSQSDAVFSLGVARAPGENVPGPRTQALLADVEFDWKEKVNGIAEGNEIDSYRKSVELIRHGLVAGPSSGLNLVGLLSFLQNRYEAGTLDAIRNSEGEVVCSMICCDIPFLYIDRYLSLLADEL